MMTYKQATAMHLAALAALGWDTSPALKVPHATSPDGVRIYFRAQAVHAAPKRGALGSARSLWIDQRKASTEELIREAESLARDLAAWE